MMRGAKVDLVIYALFSEPGYDL